MCLQTGMPTLSSRSRGPEESRCCLCAGLRALEELDKRVFMVTGALREVNCAVLGSFLR